MESLKPTILKVLTSIERGMKESFDKWDALDEETKEARLNKIIEHCMSVGKK